MPSITLRAVTVAALVGAVTLTSSCGRNDTAGARSLPDSVGASEPAAIASAKNSTVDGALTLPATTQTKGARTSEELLAKFPAAQRSAIERFYAAYGQGPFGVSQYNFRSAIDFKNEKQYEWLRASGFPTPDEVVAAATMSDADLRRLADDGNLKASIFLLRRLSEVSASGQTLTSDQSELAHRLTTAVIASGLPFAGYVVADRGRREGRPEDVIAGYSYAAYLGDSRALDFMRSFEASGVPVSAMDSLTSYRLLISTSMRNPALADLRAVASKPAFPRFN